MKKNKTKPILNIIIDFIFSVILGYFSFVSSRASTFVKILTFILMILFLCHIVYLVVWLVSEDYR